MNLTLRNHAGGMEAVIDEDCGLKRFYEVANILTEQLSIRFIKKEDDFDTLTWQFVYKGQSLNLFYNIFTGISIFPRKLEIIARKENNAVLELARFLENKLLTESGKKYAS